MNLCKILWIV